MKRLGNLFASHGILLAALMLPLVILASKLYLINENATYQEAALLKLTHSYFNLTNLRLLIVTIIILNTYLGYKLFNSWFDRRRAALALLLAGCIPLWLTIQYALPHLAALLSLTLITMLAFDRAGRSDQTTAWYTLAGLTFSAAWLLEPVGLSILACIGLGLLVICKPRYIKHITRQASLVIIILIVTVATLVGASLKFSLGVQERLANQITSSLQINFSPWVSLRGTSSYILGIPGLGLIPLAVMVLSAIGAWWLLRNRRRPRNIFVLLFPLLALLTSLCITGLGSALLISLSLLGFATWAACGIEDLYTAWHQLFPNNQLAKLFSVVVISITILSLATYSCWYITRAWSGSPQTRIDAAKQWSGRL